jgi:hypothetical protein
MSRLLFLFSLVIWASPALSEYVEIWSYAFTTRTDEPIAGHGAAIFNPKSGGLVGPMLSQEKLTYEFIFQVSGHTAQGTFTSTKGPKTSIALRGDVTHVNQDDGCLVQIIFREGVHNVVLERVAPERCEAN